MRGRIVDMYRRYVTRAEAPTNAIPPEILKNRKETLRFRDVANELDIVKLNRDFVLSLKVLKYGAEYTIDLALEKELSYHQLHASRELNFNSGKLIEGPSKLHPLGIPLPRVEGLKRFTDDSDVFFDFTTVKRPTILHIVHLSTSTMEHVKKWDAPGLDVVVFYNAHSTAVHYMRNYLINHYRKNAAESLPVPIESCYHGEYLLRSLMPTLDIRNYFMNHVLLLDHSGKVRWISSWTPNEREQRILPKLCEDLQKEYLRHVSS
eukprot:PhM_4_TR2528/c0_g1_i1/m.34730